MNEKPIFWDEPVDAILHFADGTVRTQRLPAYRNVLKVLAPTGEFKGGDKLPRDFFREGMPTAILRSEGYDGKESPHFYEKVPR